MTVVQFSLSPALEKEFVKNRVRAVSLDMLEDIKHIFGGEAKDCTLPEETAHTFWNHIADISVDIPYLFPNRRIFQFTRFLFLALAFWFVIGQPLIKGIANISAGQPLVPNIGQINLPAFLAPPTATPTSTVTPSPTPTLTPTITPSPTVTPTPTATPIVFAREEECDPIPDENPWPFYSSLAKFIFEKKAFEEWESGLMLTQAREGNSLSIAADMPPGVKGVYALERAEWEPFLDSNRYCQVNGQWMPLPPYEDLRILFMPP